MKKRATRRDAKSSPQTDFEKGAKVLQRIRDVAMTADYLKNITRAELLSLLDTLGADSAFLRRKMDEREDTSLTGLAAVQMLVGVVNAAASQCLSPVRYEMDVDGVIKQQKTDPVDTKQVD